jgi:hypothetical protein
MRNFDMMYENGDKELATLRLSKCRIIKEDLLLKQDKLDRGKCGLQPQRLESYVTI